MKRMSIIEKFTVVIITALVMAAASPAPVFAEDDNLYLPVYADYDRAYEVLDMINSERSKHGAGRLSMDQRLMDAAYVRAAETILYFEHARPNGGSWNSVDSKVSGENLGRGTGSTSKIMQLWMASPGHRANIVRSVFGSVGVACIEYEGNYYWVQLFGHSGSEGAERPENGIVSLALDLPAAEEGGSFALDYAVTANGSDEPKINVGAGSQLQMGLRGDYLDFDPAKTSWKVSNPEVASINEEGVIRISEKGRVKITASSGSIERASMEIDSREDVSNMYIMDTFRHTKEITYRSYIDGELPKPDVTILSDEGPLQEGKDYSVRYMDEGGKGTAEIRGMGGYKGIADRDYDLSGSR